MFMTIKASKMYQNLLVDQNVDSIIKSLKKYGIAIIPSYVDNEELPLLKDEFIKSFTYNGKGFYSKHKHPTNEDGMVVRLNREQLVESDFPFVKKVFGSTFMENVLKKYFAPHNYKLNEDIFITHEKPCETPILPWHHDRVQALKFYIYLKDTTTNDGAFEYAPGTHNEGHYRANYHLATGTPLQQLPNDIPEEEILNPVTIEGKAGDLIIFDPDGFHRGGIVGDGGERMVMRGHSHPFPVQVSYGKARLFSKNWFLQSKFNLAKLFRTEYSRVLGDGIQSKAAKNRVDYQENLLEDK